jgi:hypothetical protein
MDEFVHYHALGCLSAPEQRGLPPMRDGCFAYDLRPPFTSRPLPLRSYAYIGSLPVLPFYPFWRLLSDPVAARVQGALLFLAFAWLAGRALGVLPSSLALATLLFPTLVATFVVDQGPVALSAVLLLLALLAARRALDEPARTRAAAWAAATGFLLFLGVWVKLLFAWWLPLVALVTLERATRGGLSPAAVLRRHAPALAAGALALALPTALLLSSVDRDGRPYAAALFLGRTAGSPGEVARQAQVLLANLEPSQLAPRNLSLPAWPSDPVPLLAAAWVLVGGARRQAARRRELATWAVQFPLTLLLVSPNAQARWPHHLAYALVPLVAAIALAADGLGRRGRLALGVVVVGVWATIALRLPQASSPREANRDKDALLAFVRASGLDARSLQVHTSWGTSYIAQLFGDRRRAVLYLKGLPDDEARLWQVRALARERGRPLLLLSSRRPERVQTPQLERALGRPSRAWRFGDWWALEYRPDPGALRSASLPP